MGSFKDLESQTTSGSLSPLHQIFLLSFFTLTRTLHPLIIEKSKEPLESGKMGFRFEAVAMPLLECAFTFVAAQLMVLGSGGLEQWREIWRPKPMTVFSMIGFLYAFGDYLELKAMGGLSGAAYQVVIQSKLLVTAVMLWGIKGQRQTTLQWILLMLLMLSLVCYALMKDMLMSNRALSAGQELKEGEITPMGVAMGVLKVVVSCLGAVLTDKYMKHFKSEPIPMQIAQFKGAWFVTLLCLVAADGEALQKGLFHDWSATATVVFGSFTVKCWSSMYLLAILDSMLKNIGEAFSVLLVYFIVVWHPGWDDKYENETFISLMSVFLSVVAYLVAKNVVTKASEYDKEHGTGNAISTQKSQCSPLVLRGREAATRAVTLYKKKWHLLVYGFLLCFLIPMFSFRSYASLNGVVGSLGLPYTVMVTLCLPQMVSRNTRALMLLLYPLAWLLCDPIREYHFSERGASK